MSTDPIEGLEAQFGDERASAAAAIAAAMDLVREKLEAVSVLTEPLFAHFADLLQQSLDTPSREERSLIDAVTAAVALNIAAKVGALGVAMNGPENVPRNLQMLVSSMMENVAQALGQGGGDDA